MQQVLKKFCPLGLLMTMAACMWLRTSSGVSYIGESPTIIPPACIEETFRQLSNVTDIQYHYFNGNYQDLSKKWYHNDYVAYNYMYRQKGDELPKSLNLSIQDNGKATLTIGTGVANDPWDSEYAGNAIAKEEPRMHEAQSAIIKSCNLPAGFFKRQTFR